jgi:hypothetical protein
VARSPLYAGILTGYLTDYKPDPRWQRDCKITRHPAMPPGRGGRRSRTVKTALTAWLMIALLLIGVSVGRAYEADETIINVEVSSADHVLQEGYFALGEQGTVMAKPGSQLYNFLSRQRGQKVKIVLTPAEKRELARIQR